MKLERDGEVLDIGYADDETDPEKWFDQVGALDGGIDALSGHGTFISGLIHQACPDADILVWRVVGSDGPIVESELVKTLERIAEVARKHRDGEKGGYPIDVLNLSMGYYHETPKDKQFDKTMYEHPREARPVRRRGGLLGRQRRHGARDVPGRVRPVGRTAPRPCKRRTGMPYRSPRSARSTPTATPTRCSATPARG